MKTTNDALWSALIYYYKSYGSCNSMWAMLCLNSVQWKHVLDHLQFDYERYTYMKITEHLGVLYNDHGDLGATFYIQE